MSSVNDPLGAWTVYRINTWNNANVGLSQCNAQTPCFGDYPQVREELETEKSFGGEKKKD